MKDFLDALVSGLNEGNYVVVIIVILTGILFNLKVIFAFIDERNKAKSINIKAAIEVVDENSKRFFEDELMTEHFRLVTGIRLEKHIRNAILDLYEKSKGNLGFNHFKRAIIHLSLVNSKLTVKIGAWDRFLFGYNIFVSAVLAMAALFFFILPKLVEKTTILEILFSFSLSLVLLLTSAFFVFQLRPLISARYIQEEIDKQHSEEST